MGRPRLPDGQHRVRLNVRVDGELRRRLDAFQVQEEFSTVTEALEWLLKRGLRGVEQLEPYRSMAHEPDRVVRERVASLASVE
jgi:hypothetical protein